MPKVTSAPPRAAAAARDVAAAKAASSAIMWSDGSSSISASGSLSASAKRRDAGGGCGVAADRLEQQGPRRRADLAQLLGDDKAMLFIGDEQRRGKAVAIGDAAQGLLQQAVVAEQTQQLLGIKGARHRPQPGAGAAGQDDRVNHCGTPSCCVGGAADAFPAKLAVFRVAGNSPHIASPAATNRQIRGA